MRCVPGVAIVMAAVAGPVHAQSNDTSATAERLFRAARDLVAANRWAEACPKFEDSLRHDPVTGTRLNLAACYEHVGRLASAWQLYRESVEVADKAGDRDRRDFARRRIAVLTPRLPRLVISVRATTAAGLVIVRDGVRIDPNEPSSSRYVDPGTHQIVASAPGFEPFSDQVTLLEGQTKTLTIPELKAASRASTSVIARSRAHEYVAITGATVGVAAIAVGLLFGARAMSQVHDARARCGDDLACEPDTLPEGQRLLSEARSSSMKANMFLGLGGAAIVTAAVALYLRPSAGEGMPVHLVPVVGGSGAGLAVMGRF